MIGLGVFKIIVPFVVLSIFFVSVCVSMISCCDCSLIVQWYDVLLSALSVGS